jgi:hypothetical protein
MYKFLKNPMYTLAEFEPGKARQILFKNIFYHLFFLKHTQWQCNLSYDNSTAMYKFLKKPYVLPGGIRTREG